jgi:FMN phosphatase YigB (HAD superfamily)
VAPDDGAGTHASLRAWHDRPGPGLLTVDVFDTLLLRDEQSELVRFAAAAEQAALALHGRTPQEVLAARGVAHRLAYRMAPAVAGVREASARDIWSAVCRRLGLPEEPAVAVLRAAELTVETRSVRPLHAVWDLVANLHGQGWTTVAVSDMYYSADDLRSLLGAHGDLAVLDDVVTSGDAGRTKATGLLADVRHAHRDRARSAWLHVGDNLEGEIVPAQQLGATVLHLPLPAGTLARVVARGVHEQDRYRRWRATPTESLGR